MKNRKIKIGILAGIVVLAAILLIAFLKYSNGPKKSVSNDNLSGNIGNISSAESTESEGAAENIGSLADVDMFSDDISPNMKEFEKKVYSDRQFREQLMFSLTYIEAHAGELASISKMALKVIEDEPENVKLQTELNEITKVANSTLFKTNLAVESFTLMINGEKNTKYEQFSIDAIASLLLLDKYNQTGKDFVAYAEKYIKKNGLENNLSLAFIADQWSSYLAMESFLNNDQKEMNIWKERKTLLDSRQTRQEYIHCTRDVRQSFYCAQAMDSFIAPDFSDNQDRLVTFHNNDAVVGMHTVCATLDQINQLYLNRSGWTVVVLENDIVNKICIIDDENMLLQKKSSGKNKLFETVKEATPLAFDDKMSTQLLRSSIVI